MSRRLLLALPLALAALLAPGFIGSASADTTRCVGSPDLPGAFACYTSPRFDHIGLVRVGVAPVPVVCYGLGCTGAELMIFEPSDQVGGRFTAVTYLGNTYTVYRPTEDQQYVVRSNSATFQPIEGVQELLIAVALDAAGQ